MKRKCIISIDGGGIRGVLPLMVLAEMEKYLLQNNVSEPISSYFDVIAGTSTGAIIATGMMVKENDKFLYSVQDLFSLYAERGPQLFNLAQPDGAQSEGLRLLLKRKFKGKTLGDLSVDFNLVSYDQTNEVPFVFSNKQEMNQYPISKALAACSAIPGMFSPIEYKNRLLIDGLFTAKNPAELVYQYVKNKYPEDEIVLLSLGTGLLFGEWYDHFEKEVDEVDVNMQKQHQKDDKLTYFRFQPKIITAHQDSANASRENINALLVDGERFLAENQMLVEQVVAELLTLKKSL